MGKVKSSVLTEKQHEGLVKAGSEAVYPVYGNITKKWYVCYQKLDKYAGGYDTKEEADAVISSGAYLDKDMHWNNGNSFVL